jgi:uncharacterized protein (DUF58 family)
MNHRDGAISKMEYARYLAASLGYLAQKQGDTIGLDILQDGQLYSLASKKDAQHLARFLYQLENIKAGGKFTEPAHYKNLFTGLHQRSLLIFITDFYQEGTEILDLLQAMVSLKHEVIVFQLLAENEMELNYKGYDQVKDLETGATIPIQLGTQKENQESLNRYLKETRKELLNINIVYRQMLINEPLDLALRDFLNQRNKNIQ